MILSLWCIWGLALLLTGWIATPSQELRVHFIDVGQGDSILVQTIEGRTMLIDGGDRNQGPRVVEYLIKEGVREIDVMVATHPHADHIGGLIAVLESFPVRKVYMPEASHTTRTYRDFMEALRQNGAQVETALAGVELELEGVDAVLVAPVSRSYRHLNLYSVVIHLQFGHIAFLFTGDTEQHSEEEMLESEAHLRAQVLKAGHHGSRTSSSLPFLKAIAPRFAVVMCGEGNSYGHPHIGTLTHMDLMDVTVFRTDLHGTLVTKSWGWGVRMEFPDLYPELDDFRMIMDGLWNLFQPFHHQLWIGWVHTLRKF